jgi:pimeloyl-ACP methyl ester carboxylesterase
VSARLVSFLERGGRFALNRRGFASRTVVTRAGPVHVYDGRGRGTLPTVVVLHGLGSAATTFAPVLNRLLPHAGRVVAPDLPGHGFSPSPAQPLTAELLGRAVGETLDELIDERMVLMGSSLGGALALLHAVRRPEKVAALALVSPAGARVTDGEWDTLVRTFHVDSPAQARRLIGLLYHRTPWYLPALAGGVQTLMNRPAVRDLLASATVADLPTPESLRDLPMPVLLLWGRSERLLPSSSLEYFRKHLPPHAIIEQPVGFGHCPHFDDPARLSARVVAFAREAVAARRDQALL